MTTLSKIKLNQVVKLNTLESSRPSEKIPVEINPAINPDMDPENNLAHDLDAPEWYLNRELTWLEFNRRVLHEATDAVNPLLERLKFFAIFASNIDEFFMKRVGSLKLLLAANITELTVDGRTPEQQLQECAERVNAIEDIRNQSLPTLLKELEAYDIRILDYDALEQKQQDFLRLHYLENIFPLVTPQIFDPAHPFPFISNLSLNILVTLQPGIGEEAALARVKVPVGAGISRFVRIGDTHHYVPLEQIIAQNLDLLFPGEKQIDYDYFFVTRNAGAERQESGTNDLLSMIELELRDRRIAPIVRLVVNPGMEQEKKRMIVDQLGLDADTDVFETPNLMAQRDLFELINLPIAGLHYPPHHPTNHHRLQDTQRSIFYLLREAESMLLQHPYESFTSSVVRFLEEAANDNKVRAIKMSLYRTDKETRVVDLLVQAAKNGKQVAVVVEIKAKFDEAANIQWAESMEEAGIHVTYGVIGLKTHCKVLMVVRQDYSKLRRYVHIGTGNYHGGTAKQYTDLGLLTCDEEIGHDVTELFNYLTTGHSRKRNFQRILVAPKQMKKELMDRIHREVANMKNGHKGLIQIKSNALEDQDMVRALYQASMAGVKIDLIIRDTCRLRPGVAGLSDNISVISIVGRFLEHSRIFYFFNAGKEEYLIGSADLMKRNLESRVEVITPIDKESLKIELRLIFNTLLDDQMDSWEMQSDGTYIKRKPKSAEAIGCQVKQMEFAQTRLKTKRYKKLLRTVSARKRN
ncbi:polyphosphate kinase 1 [Candidatus Spongiihabitans sp.]|uniref:polyphosphate kinase 1 n=1 Tax=Candidatus Spongiihabitans sp. TaxID=3101308 RepID=UPI003C7CA46E